MNKQIEELAYINAVAADNRVCNQHSFNAGRKSVLAELTKQEPFGYVYMVNGSWYYFDDIKPPEDAYDAGTLIEVFAAPPVPAVPQWISVDDRLPEVELGGEMHCFVAIRNKTSGKVSVIDGYWCNKPSDPEWDETIDAPDWALQTADDGYLNLVGWAEITHHPDYSGYYEPIDQHYAEIIAWQQIVYPASPEPTK